MSEPSPALMLAIEEWREQGRAEVRARVEAVLTEHSTGAVTTPIDRRLLADLRAALNGGE